MVEPMLVDPKESRWYKEIAEEERQERNREIARNMLKKGMAPKLVEEITGLSAREVRALGKELAAQKI